MCRFWLALLALIFAASFGHAAHAAPAPIYPEVRPGAALAFPADHGAHPEYRTEWWYITGWLDSPSGPLGFQITFFRFRTGADADNPSAFAPKQVLLAHAALSDPAVGHMLHDQHTARAGFGLAEAKSGDTDVVLDRWSLKRNAQGVFHAAIPAKDFTLDLTFTSSQPPLLQGDKGYSRKGPDPKEASYYYSLPHLAVSGMAGRNGAPMRVTGSAWFDHEFSSTFLNSSAVGWDWAGLNLEDGTAVMAFVIRDAKGSAIWAGGTLRAVNGTTERLGPDAVQFAPIRRWRSPQTGAEYPVETTLSLRLPNGERRFALKPLLDDQELDSRAAGGPVYWEGAVRTDGGRGYLELTGYFRPLKM